MNSIRIRWIAATAAIALASTAIAQTPLGEPYSRAFGAEAPADVKTLVFVLHGDAPFAKPSYHYTFAAEASKLPGVRAIGILRPGYEDKDGDISPGVRGLTTGDNYTPDRVDAIARAMADIEARYPRARHIVVGHSGGAAIAADLAALRPDLVDGVLLVSCPCDLPKWRAFMKKKMPQAPFDRPVDSYNSIALVPRLSPRLALSMMVGSADDIAPPDLTQAYAAAARARGIPVDLRILPGKPHDILNEPEVIPALRDLIAKVNKIR
ncbi:alpha/beta fold hydrolase [Sphingomonas pruni]|uniref:alpha/beta fold hydrolase n=1 Tax=Sphingomonas pruni TaxID=40683 RepID=UPI0008330A82|nr:alpha/beta hydrolase [Sphingomonas pruni]